MQRFFSMCSLVFAPKTSDGANNQKSHLFLGLGPARIHVIIMQDNSSTSWFYYFLAKQNTVQHVSKVSFPGCRADSSFHRVLPF